MNVPTNKTVTFTNDNEITSIKEYVFYIRTKTLKFAINKWFS